MSTLADATKWADRLHATRDGSGFISEDDIIRVMVAAMSEASATASGTLPAAHCAACGAPLTAEEVHCDDCGDMMREDEGWTAPPDGEAEEECAFCHRTPSTRTDCTMCVPRAALSSPAVTTEGKKLGEEGRGA